MLKRLIPTRIKEIIREFLGINYLHRRMELLNDLLLESKTESWERSRKRWKQSNPNISLTWNKEVSGDNFIRKVKSFTPFSYDKSIIEIGVGYGRLLNSCLKLNVPFKEYMGVDISEKNIDYLRSKFVENNINFYHGDVETAVFTKKFDVLLSSLTFKHLYPSFEKALQNIKRFMIPGSLIFFDLIEGEKKYFDDHYGVCYLRHYTKKKILEILKKVSIDFIAFDRVEHDHNHIRLLVVARK